MSWRINIWLRLAVVLWVLRCLLTAAEPMSAAWVVDQLRLIDDRTMTAGDMRSAIREISRTSGAQRWLGDIVQWRYESDMLGKPLPALRAIITNYPRFRIQGKAEAPLTPWSELGLLSPSAWAMGGTDFHAAITIARLLAAAGRTQESMGVIGTCKGAADDGIAYGWVALAGAEAFCSAQHWERALDAVESGIAALHPAAGSDGTSVEPFDPTGERQVVRYELSRMRDRAKRQRDLEAYGEAYLLYRDAEWARRREADEATAWSLYEQVRITYPGTILAEASEAYGIACLTTFAGIDYKRRLDERHASIERRLQALTRVMVDLVDGRASSAMVVEHRRILDDQQRLMRTLHALPATGATAAALAVKRAETFIARSPRGLYRGEALISLGDLAWEVGLRPAEGRTYYRQARLWFEALGLNDQAMEACLIEPRHQEVSAPPATMRTTDQWGNLCWSNSLPGAIVNQRTATWYVGYWRLRAALRETGCAIAVGDAAGARELLPIVAEEDPAQHILAERGMPTIPRRLADDIAEGRLFATKEEFAAFPSTLQPQLLVAELAFETERYSEAARMYKLMKKDHGERLSAAAVSYLDYHDAIATITADRKRAVGILRKIADQGGGSRTWVRAKFDLFVLTQTLEPDAGGAITHLDDVMKLRAGTPAACEAAYLKASFLAARGRDGEARQIFQVVRRAAPSTWLDAGSRRQLELLGHP